MNRLYQNLKLSRNGIVMWRCHGCSTNRRLQIETFFADTELSYHSYLTRLAFAIFLKVAVILI